MLVCVPHVLSMCVRCDVHVVSSKHDGDDYPIGDLASRIGLT